MSHDLSHDPILRDAIEIEGYKVLGPCVLYARIGQGGMGVVYRGRHVNLEIEVAVKCLLPALMAMDGDLVTRFQREAQLAARVTHQNLVRVYDVGEESGLHYLIMEYVTGETLRERVEREGACAPDVAVTIVRQAAAGLAAAHDEEIVHRDIKPDNILVSEKGIVKVADLGLGRIGHGPRDLTISRVPMGTPTYMPPEQWKAIGRVGPQGDVWALGATLFFLLAGESAFQGDSMREVQEKICDAPFPHDRLSSVPLDLLDVLRRCTERLPGDRYPNARELAQALDGVAAAHGFDGALKPVVRQTVFEASFAGGDSVPVPPRSVLERVREQITPSRASQRAPTAPTVALPSSRRTWLAWGGGIAALVFLGFGAFLAVREWKPSSNASTTSGVGSAGAGSAAGGAAGTNAPPGYPGFTFVGTNAYMLHEYRHEKSGIVMVRLPGGPFRMGSPEEGEDDDDARDDEKPRHSVWLSPFFIAKYEVSQAEWERIVGTNPAPEQDRQDTFPVSNVSWDDCSDFCRETGLQLPTEAQWEYACRAGTSTRFSLGDGVSDLQANFDNSEGGLLPVDALPANRFGLHHMHGNVSEWCRDYYHDGCYREKKQRGEERDPVCDESEEGFRVYRGGNFQFPMGLCRSAVRHSDEPDVREPIFGLRPVYELEE